MKKLDFSTVQNILKEHKDITKDKHFHELSDGRFVIGKFVDKGNHLHYIVRNKNKSCEVIDAEKVQVSKFFLEGIDDTPVKSTVTFSESSEPQITLHKSQN